MGTMVCYQVCQNRTFLTVHSTGVAMEVEDLTLPSSTLKLMESTLKVTILIMLPSILALSPMPTLPTTAVVASTPKLVMNPTFRMQLPLMPAHSTSSSTSLESLMTHHVVLTTLTSTMLSLLLVMTPTPLVSNTGSSRTPGVTHGVMVDTLSLLVTRAICVVLPPMLLLPKHPATAFRFTSITEPT